MHKSFQLVYFGYAKEREEAHSQKKEVFGLLAYREIYLCHSNIRFGNNFCCLVALFNVIQLLSLILREKSPHSVVMIAEETSPHHINN
jgi:hypothetical protein